MGGRLPVKLLLFCINTLDFGLRAQLQICATPELWSWFRGAGPGKQPGAAYQYQIHEAYVAAEPRCRYCANKITVCKVQMLQVNETGHTRRQGPRKSLDCNTTSLQKHDGYHHLQGNLPTCHALTYVSNSG